MTETAAGPSAGPLWYKDAIIYEAYVRSFRDSDGNGIGDFRGLTEKLDYLSALGITCIWLLPFYPSPMKDGGYDISDYTAIHPDFGTMRDFTRFVRESHARGIRVITELVVNHTSDQHPWFQRARRAPRGSAWRNMYVWSDTDTGYAGSRIIFTDTETSNWTWDPVAGQYYWHRFFSHQPDLNFANPRVIEAVKSYIKFWLDRGVDGMRLDAVPYLCEREGTSCENLPETHDVLKQLRGFVDEHFEDRVLLAEANQWPPDVVPYFGDGRDECQMAFHFPLMPRMFMALYQEDRHPVVDITEQTPEIPQQCQWALFLRNHDELTLEMVTDEERDYMYQTYATDPRMRVNVGIRRRLAPLLNNNRRAIELLNSLLFSLPGTPIIYYGDEIGMGDNIFLGDRDGVRTPVQWSGDRNAGFSSADPARLYLPVIMDPLYGYQAVNVEAQERSPSSLLNWMRRMIALRRDRSAIFGRGSLTMLHPDNRSVLAFLRSHEDDVVLVVANLSRFVQPVELDLSGLAGAVPEEMIGKQRFPPVGDQPYFLTLGPHAFYWFDLVREPELAVAHPERRPVVHVNGDWGQLLEGAALRRVEREFLPEFLPTQRWFGGKDARIRSVTLREAVPLRAGANPSWLALVDVEARRRPKETYALPLAVLTGRGAKELSEADPRAIIAQVEGARGRGILVDGMATESVCIALLDFVDGGRPLAGRAGDLVAERGRAFGELRDALEDRPTVQRSGVEQSNTSVRLDSQLIIKLMRRIEPGVHPEIEVTRHLTERVKFPRTPRYAGAICYEPREGERATLASLTEFAWNQGDGWSFMLGEVRRFLEEAPLIMPTDPREEGVVPIHVEHSRILGQRTAEMHLALADSRGDPAFEPEHLTRRDLATVASRVRRRIRRLRPALRRLAAEPAPEAADAQFLLDAEATLRDALGAVTSGVGRDVMKIRVHGDYHLGQVLWVRDDFLIVDFEGEVGLPLAERRTKACVMTDVAGMLRSFQYAALVALRDHVATMPDEAAETERSRPWAEWWERHSAGRFLDGYLEAAAGAPFLPPEEDQRRTLLDLYLLDKALHELEYELDHRPEWVPVPLQGVAATVRAWEGVAP